MSVTTTTQKPQVKRRFVWLWYAFWVWTFLDGLYRNRPDASSITLAVTLLITLIIATEIVLRVAAVQRFNKVAAQQAATERTQVIIQEIESSPLTAIQAPGIVLHSGEVAYLQTQAQVAAPHTTTRRTGRYGGFSVPTPIKGVRMNLGQYASKPVSSTSFANEGPATITLTNQRIIISGTFGNRTYTLKSVVGIEPYTDGVKLDVANKKPVLLMTGDIRLGATISKVLQQQ